MVTLPIDDVRMLPIVPVASSSVFFSTVNSHASMMTSVEISRASPHVTRQQTFITGIQLKQTVCDRPAVRPVSSKFSLSSTRRSRGTHRASHAKHVDQQHLPGPLPNMRLPKVHARRSDGRGFDLRSRRDRSPSRPAFKWAKNNPKR